MATSRLENIGNAAKTAMTSKNTFNGSTEYGPSSPYAQTPLGKESLGNTADISARTKQTVKNMFNPSNEYGPTNLY